VCFRGFISLLARSYKNRHGRCLSGVMQLKIHTASFSAAMAAVVFTLGGGCATRPPQEPATAAQAEDNAINIGKRFTLQSKILNEARPYLVYLPGSYHQKVFAPKKYAVLYLLDGDAHFQSASGVVQFMSAGINANIQIPELIVVAIPNTRRTRDLTPTHTIRSYSGKEEPNFSSSGGGESFLRFIAEELIPHIEAEYRTQPFRILVGHSFGGLFAMNALLHRPSIFQAYLAIDPSLWWDDQILLRRLKDMVQTTNDFLGPVYISVANNPPSKDFDPKIGQQACRDFADILKTNSSPSFRTALQYFDAEDHGSVPLLSLYHGLLFLFEGYKPTSSTDENLVSLNDHFAKVSARLGFAVRPPEEFVNSVAWAKLNFKRETNNAVEWLKANVSNYPDSPNVYASLAEAYELQGEKQLAIENYQKSLELNSENRDAARRLRRLRPFPETPGGPLSNGVYRVINQRTGKALEVAGASTADRAVVDQGRWNNGLHQQWMVRNLGDGYYQVTAAHSGKALDVNALSTRNGARVIQWTTNGGPNQIWQPVPNGDGTYRLLNDQSGLALQVANSSGTNGAWMEQWQWKAQDQQKWRFYRLSNPSK